MADLINVYENMLQNQEAVEEEAIEKNAEEAVVEERLDVLTKYATVADNMLAKEYGDDYAQEDVTQLAAYLIDEDARLEEQQEKVAEYHQLGQIIARGFQSELAAMEEEVKEEEK